MFEFIFLDLCLELYQDEAEDDRIFQCIKRHMQKSEEQPQKQGIKTNLNVCREFLKKFINYTLRVRPDCLDGLDQCMGPTSADMLRYMHSSGEEDL